MSLSDSLYSMFAFFPAGLFTNFLHYRSSVSEGEEIRLFGFINWNTHTKHWEVDDPRTIMGKNATSEDLTWDMTKE